MTISTILTIVAVAVMIYYVYRFMEYLGDD